MSKINITNPTGGWSDRVPASSSLGDGGGSGGPLSESRENNLETLLGAAKHE